MTRLRILATLGLVASLLFATSAPADARTHNAAWWPKTSCKSWGNDGLGGGATLCLDVYVDKGDTGLILRHVYLRLEHSGNFESHAFDCLTLIATKSNDDTVWRKDGPACDVDNPPGYTLFHPQHHMPNSNTVSVRVGGYPKIDHAPDPGYQTIQVTVSR